MLISQFNQLKANTILASNTNTGTNIQVFTGVMNANGVKSIDWVGRAMYNPNGTVMVDWLDGYLFDYNSLLSLSWQNRELVDTSSTISADWDARNLKDTTAINSLDWGGRFLLESNGNPSVDWENKVLNSASQPVFSWASGIIYDNDVVFGQQESIGTNARQLIRSVNSSTVAIALDWQNQALTGLWTIQTGNALALGVQNPNPQYPLDASGGFGDSNGSCYFTDGLSQDINGNQVSYVNCVLNGGAGIPYFGVGTQFPQYNIDVFGGTIGTSANADLTLYAGSNILNSNGRSVVLHGGYSANTGTTGGHILLLAGNFNGPSLGFLGFQGNVGVKNLSPVYDIDVSGSGNYTKGVIISGFRALTLADTGLFVSTGQSGLFATTGNLNATGSTLQAEINTLNTWSGNSTGLYYPRFANPLNYITGSGASGYYPYFVGPSGVSTGLLIATGNNILAQFNGNTGQTFRVYNGYVNSGTGSWTEIQSSGMITTVGSGTGVSPLTLGVGRTGWMTITTGGRIGVGSGNAAPTAMLDVASPTSNTDIFRLAYKGASYNFMRVYSPSANFGFGAGTAIYELPDSNHYLNMTAAQPWTWYSSDPIDFEGANIYLNATSHAGATVSIGTQSANTTLEVNGTFGNTANGNDYLLNNGTSNSFINNQGGFVGIGQGVGASAQYNVDIWNGSTPPSIGTSAFGNPNYIVLDNGGGYMQINARYTCQVFTELDVGNGSYADPSPGHAYDVKCGGPNGGIASAGAINTNSGYLLNNNTIIDASANASFNTYAINGTQIVDASRNGKFNTLAVGQSSALYTLDVLGSGRISGNCYLSGNMSFGTAKVSGNFTIGTGQSISLVNVSVSGSTGTMPNASGCYGMEYTIKDWKGNSALKNIIITGFGSQTFDGASSLTINSNYGSYSLVSDGSNWAII